MARTQGTFSLSANIEVAAGAPLDARDRVSAKSDLTASGAFPYHWIGMETYVVAENKKYRLIGSDPTVLANWEEVGSGGSGGASDLNDLDDVNITSATNGQVLKYDSQNQVWVNANESGGGGASDLSDLDDVNITSATNGQVLKYDSQNQEWVNANESGGTTVVANPTGTATTDLTKLQVDNTIYGIPEGTTVVANPSSTATADLEKLQVGSTVYEVPEGTTVVANPSGTATADLTKLQVGNDIYSIPDEDTDALEDLTDVDLTSVANGQVLKYDSTSGKWVNANESGSGSGHTIEDSTGTDMTARTNLQFKGAAAVSDDSTNDRTIVDVPKMTAEDLADILTPLPAPVTPPDLEELSDVNITSASNGQVLKYDAANQEWVNANESGGGASDLDDLSDVNITSPTSGQVLKYDSQNQEWINANDEGGTTVVANPSGTSTADLAKLQVGSDIYGVPDTDELSELTDVNITSVANGQVLKYDSASSKWINANESGGSGHTIENASGTDMTARANLQFTGGAVSVSDDSTNDRTVVTVPDVMASTDMSEIISPLPMPAATPDLEDLGDINITTPTNGQVLKYDSQNQEWINANESGGGGTGGHTIEDGTGTSMTERASLQFKGAAQVSDDSANDRTVVDVPKMTAEDLEDILTPLPAPVLNPEVGELSDVNLTSLANGQVLKYDSQNQEWVNANESGGASYLEDLEDVNISALSDGQILKYDSTNQEWVNANESGGTTVIANPTGTPTDDLNSIQIGTNIYNIVGGGGSGGGSCVPVGTIITIMGTSAPSNYLVCDGSTYNISSYPELSSYFNDQFGSSNYFGGDGITTFAVPDLQGEFLRGSGTNSHTNQGNGASVGTHQDATVIPIVTAYDKYFAAPGIASTKSMPLNVENPDTEVNQVSDHSATYVSGSSTSSSTYPYNGYQKFTSRPTNTSVLYCIATKNISSGSSAANYSTTEQVIGTWIDGKPIYRIVLDYSSNPFTGSTTIDVTNLHIDKLIFSDAMGSDSKTYGSDIWTLNSVSGASSRMIYMTDINTLKVTGSYYKDWIILEYTKSTDNI